MIRFILLWLGMTPFLLAQTDRSCGQAEYASFVAYAQSADPLAEALGRKLLECDRTDYRESALFWLSFYYVHKGQDARARALGVRQAPASSEKARLQQSALNGETTALAQRVQKGESGYSDDPWILLSLARGQMRAGQYPAAFASYQLLARNQDSQDAAEAEWLFAYIWAKDEQAARSKIAALRRFELGAYLRQSCDRAEQLLGGPIREDQAYGSDHGTWLSLAFLQKRDNRGYSVQGGRARYRGPIEWDLEAVQHKGPLEAEASNVASLMGTHRFNEGEAMTLDLGLGYFSEGPENITGLLRSDYEPTEGWRFGVGIRRQPVALAAFPPPAEHAGRMRDSVEGSVQWLDRAALSGAVHSEDSDALFEEYNLEIGLKALPKHDSGFGVFLPFRLANRPMPSPDYRTYPRERRAGIGFRLGLTDDHLYRVLTEAVLESIDRSDYARPDVFSKLLGARLNLDARYFVQSSFYLSFAASAFTVERMPGEKEDEKSAEFLIGFGLSDASH